MRGVAQQAHSSCGDERTLYGFYEGLVSWGGIFLVIFFVAYMDVGKEREHDCMDTGGRTMPGAIVEDAVALLETKK